MLCPAGTVLFQKLDAAAERREFAKSGLRVVPKRRREQDEEESVVRTEFEEALMNWITHRGFCIECRGVVTSYPARTVDHS
jgi:hypothetical protein